MEKRNSQKPKKDINLYAVKYEARTTWSFSGNRVFDRMKWCSSAFIHVGYTHTHENALFIYINIDNGLAPV